jgi:GTP-dependent phosphoenolpyruvate carboxykinase
MMRELLAVNADDWAKELADQEEFFKSLQPGVPQELLDEQKKLAARLGR